MLTYYDILKLQSTATQAEIETVLDGQYNQWRRLVTHHDPNVVDEANRALRTLELIRNTLGNPVERSKYDASLNIGYLATSDQLPRFATQAQNALTSPFIEDSHSANLERVDAWLCQKCKNANPIGQKFCAKCGNQIAEECVDCKKLSPTTNVFCPECGMNKAQAKRKRQEYEALLLVAQNGQKIKELQNIIRMKEAEISKIERLRKRNPFWNYDKTENKLHKELWPAPAKDFGCIGTIVFVLVTMSAGAISVYYLLLGKVSWVWSLYTPVILIIFFYLVRALQHPKVNKRAATMIQEQKNAIAQIVQEIRHLQA